MKVQSWRQFFAQQSRCGYFRKLMCFLRHERERGAVIFPERGEIFSAFSLTDLESVKVVIIGQDPYAGQNQAHGLAFSVRRGYPITPSLRNIYSELCSDIDTFRYPDHGCLESWARQGVLLMNSVLTVVKDRPNSHSNLGWEILTDRIVELIDSKHSGLIFLLWGSASRRKERLINTIKNHVLASSHPSPLSAHRGFMGCRHFSKVNDILKSQGKTPIDWNLDRS